MATAHTFVVSSHVAAPPARVWAHATSMAGVNRELWPLARMTHPAALTTLAPAPEALGRPLFRSWILAGGVLPIDRDDVTFVAFEPGRRFLERSPMLSQREWEHERIVEPAGAGCVVTDRVRFVPRRAILGSVFLPVFRATFRLRHRNLRRLFGDPRAPGA